MFHISHKRLPTAFVIKYQQTILCNKNAHTTVCPFFRCLKKLFASVIIVTFFSLRLYNIPTPFLFPPANGPLQKNTHNLLYEKIKKQHCIHNFGIRKNPPLKKNNNKNLIFRGNKSNTSSRRLKIKTETKTKPMRDLNADGDLIQLLLVICNLLVILCNAILLMS